MQPVADAIGPTSPKARRAGLDRVTQAGGQPISWFSLACEFQRDWARPETVAAIIEIVLTGPTLGYSPLVTGVAFLPLSAGLILASNLSTIALMPRVGPRPLVASGLVAVAVMAVALRPSWAGVVP